MAAEEEGGVTLGELGRRLSGLERRFDARAQELGDKIDKLQFVHRETFEAKHGALETRVNKLEEAKQFFGRSLFVSFILPIVVAVILAVVLTR